MNLREFWRFHFLKALLILVALQLLIVAIVQNYNHKPIAVRDELSVIENRELKIKPILNDSDKDDHTELGLAEFSQPLFGTIKKKGNVLYYKPNDGFIGADSLSYQVSDGKKESKSAYIVIHVNENMPANAKRDVGTVYVQNVLQIKPLANDEDAENDSLFIHEYTQPLHGQLELVDNEFVYQASSLAKADSFCYSVGDGKSISEKAVVYINVKSKNDACYPWLSADVGDVAIAGNLTCANGKMIVEASGSDIWNPYDGFSFTYQAIAGDCEMITKVESLGANHEWAKAGIMFRESNDGGSPNVFIGMTLKHGVGYQCRYNENEGTNGIGGKDAIAAPYWLKLNRTGNLFTSYVSADGEIWEEIGKQQIELNTVALMGFAVTSHNNEEMAKFTFSNFTIKK